MFHRQMSFRMIWRGKAKRQQSHERARRLSKLHPSTCQLFLTEPDSQAAAIAERDVVVLPIGRMMPEQHDNAPGCNRLSSISFSTPEEIRHIDETRSRSIGNQLDEHLVTQERSAPGKLTKNRRCKSFTG